MADYDVGVLALVVPAKSAPKATYRPAVSVRNNGIHDALASGYLRIYASGLLIFETELYSATLAAGATGNAQAIDYWTPTAEGFYTIHAYLSTPLDQVESNNMLAPVTVEITGATPPEPPVVTAHAAQHEEGGTDELSIDGLKGRAADPQDALAHATSHQAGGADALNVGSLQGILAQDQPAQVHGNTRHNPVMTTAAELTAHAGSVAVHTAATNLANRDTTGPDAGLVNGAQLASGSEVPNHDRMALLMDRTWGHPRQATLGLNMPLVQVKPATSPLDLIALPIPLEWFSADLQILMETNCLIVAPSSASGTIELNLLLDSDLLTSCAIDFADAATHLLSVRAGIIGLTVVGLNCFILGLYTDPTTLAAKLAPAFSTSPRAYTADDLTLHLQCVVTSGEPNFALNSHGAFIRALHPIP